MARRVGKKPPGDSDNGLENQRRDQLINAVIQLITELGFERTTMRMIADRAGVSTGLVSYYYKTKRELVAAAIERATEGVEDAWPHGPVKLERVLKRSLTLADPGALPPKFRIQLYGAAATDDELAAVVRRRTDHARDQVELSIRAGIAAGRYRADIDPAPIAMAVQATFNGLAAQSAIRGDEAVETLVHAAMSLLHLLEAAPAEGVGGAGRSPPKAQGSVESAIRSSEGLSHAEAEGLVKAFGLIRSAITQKQGSGSAS